MLKPHGYGRSWDRESGKTLKERDTVTCKHCNRVFHIEPFCDPADAGGFCTVCSSIVCKRCAYLQSLGKPCTPFVERLARMDTYMERGGDPTRDVDTFADD